MQTLVYIRSFLLGRMAWSRLNGLLLISRAFGAFEGSKDLQSISKSKGYFQINYYCFFGTFYYDDSNTQRWNKEYLQSPLEGSCFNTL